MANIKVGEKAPDFTLPSQTGDMVSLSDFKDKNFIVLYFYPKDYTLGCTAEACSFRDNYQDFKDAGAEVIGVSIDSSESHSKFAASYNLPFILLSDKNGKTKEDYGVNPSFLGLIQGRVTFVIDKQGIVRYIFSSQLQPAKHIEKSLEIIKYIN